MKFYAEDETMANLIQIERENEKLDQFRHFPKKGCLICKYDYNGLLFFIYTVLFYIEINLATDKLYLAGI